MLNSNDWVLIKYNTPCNWNTVIGYLFSYSVLCSFRNISCIGITLRKTHYGRIIFRCFFSFFPILFSNAFPFFSDYFLTIVTISFKNITIITFLAGYKKIIITTFALFLLCNDSNSFEVSSDCFVRKTNLWLGFIITFLMVL